MDSEKEVALVPRLSGRVALVTGGGTGIGAAIAERFIASGASVMITGRRLDPLQNVSKKIGATVFVGDTAKATDCQRAVKAAIGEYGKLDIIVANAGVVKAGSVMSETDKDWQDTLDINLTGVREITRAGLPEMINQGGGAILNIASVAALSAVGNMASYIASKSGVVGLTKSMAYDFGPKNVRVNALCPGWVLTPMAQEEMEEYARDRGISTESALMEFTCHYPLRRMAQPEEIAACAEFLVSEDASFVTGVALAADGGGEVVDVGTLAFEQSA